MFTEDYVSFETAKLLKENGFDWMESPFYSEQDRDEWIRNNSYSVPNEEYNSELPFDSETLTMVAPHVSLQIAMKWLRETHNIFIGVNTVIGSDKNWGYEVFIQKQEIPIPSKLQWDWFSTYEEACEGAIRYCLENLI